MSYRTPDGRAAEMPRTTDEQNRVLVEIQRHWAGDDPQRLRDLAALTLHANGWTDEMIRAAFSVPGWARRESVHKAVRRTCRELRERLAPGADVDASGFSNPAG